MKRSMIIGTSIVLAMLTVIDAYLLTASVNACSIHEPATLIAVFASGIPLVQGRFAPGMPMWLPLLCANALSLCLYMPLVVAAAAIVKRLQTRLGGIEQSAGADPTGPGSARP